MYHSFRECLEDYENFLLHVQNAKGYKYRRIQGWTDPLKVISEIRIGTGTNEKPEGYFTDPNYVTKIMNLINSYDLTKYDAVMGEDVTAQQPEPDTTTEPTGTIYRVQLGAYKTKGNAKASASATTARTGLSCFYEYEADKLYHVYCGSFSDRANADQRVRQLSAMGVSCLVKEVG